VLVLVIVIESQARGTDHEQEHEHEYEYEYEGKHPTPLLEPRELFHHIELSAETGPSLQAGRPK
jgi:hypothetical protein